MDLKSWVAMAAMAVIATSCGESSTKETNTADTVTTTMDNTAPETVPVTQTIVVPDQTRITFQTKYPNVTNPSWSRYEPMDNIDWDWSGWPRMDSSDYMVRFNVDGNDYWEWYDDGNWIGTVTTMKDYAGLPAAVNKTIQTDYSGYTIVSVDKEVDKNRTAYEVELMKGEDKVKMLIAENGSILKKKSVVGGEKTKEKNI